MSENGTVNIGTGQVLKDFSKMELSPKADEEMKTPVTITVKDLEYNALIDRGENMPELKAPICTKKFLAEVKAEICFMFAISRVRKHQIKRSPPKHVLRDMLVKKLEIALQDGFICHGFDQQC